MLRLTLFLLSCGLVYCALYKPVYELERADYYFNNFVSTYNKQYSSEKQRQERFKIFVDNLKSIISLNANDTARYAINKFSDLSPREFSKMYTGYIPSKEVGSTCSQGMPSLVKQAPDAFDWRSKNVVSPVKDQGQCGSCYTFSTTGNIESQYAIHKNGVILDLSEQQLVDCSKVNLKCNGGTMTQCMMDIMDQGGIEANSDYPYQAVSGTCQFNKSLVKVQLSGCTQYQTQDENVVKETLYQNGPLSIGLAAQALMHYNGGIISNCPGDVDHAVLLVGYGTDGGQDFWIIKNSWGSIFGEHGYFRISRGQNTCKILNSLMSSAIVA